MAVSMFVVSLTVACILLAIGFMPRDTSIVQGELRIQSRLHVYRYRLDSLRGLERVDPQAISWTSTIRLCGVGWPMKSFGWFWNRKSGVFLALADRAADLLLLEFADRKKVLISSDQGAALEDSLRKHSRTL